MCWISDGKDPSTRRWEGGVRAVERVSKRFCDWWLVNISLPPKRRSPDSKNTYKALLPAAPPYTEKTGFPEAAAGHCYKTLQMINIYVNVGNHHSLLLLIWILVQSVFLQNRIYFWCVNKYKCDICNAYFECNLTI